MKIDFLTLFPKMLEGFVSESILGRAVREGHVDLTVHNLRDWAKDTRHTVDDRPFGGGAGAGASIKPIAFLVIPETYFKEEEMYLPNYKNYINYE